MMSHVVQEEALYPAPRNERGGRNPRRLFLVAGLLLLAIPWGGCAGVKTVEKTIYQEDAVQVTLVEEEQKGEALALGLEHPWEVETNVLDAILGSIFYEQGTVFFKDTKYEAFPLPQRHELLLPLNAAPI
jgi:hypothetical protein